ncbi:GNAT family N-acetyltransferase [Thalassobaculum sp.]|uniref:GNAT family N-acetyltransferase n=1 Tax=Thalassobaculum sp. TaxID=2022740 RepID=UPI0032EF633C
MSIAWPEADIHPLSPERWPDFETLIGPKGGCGGCWCMLWRLRKRDFDAMKGEANRDAIRAVVDTGPPPGLLAYDGDRAVGWISIAPRAAFPRLETSRVMQPVDDQPVWSVSCFLIAKTHRGRRLAVDLLDAACRFASQHGATVVEGYPVAPLKASYPDTYAWTGYEKVFLRAGFREVARRSDTRPIMRRSL